MIPLYITPISFSPLAWLWAFETRTSILNVFTNKAPCRQLLLYSAGSSCDVVSHLTIISAKATPDLIPVGIIDATGRVNSYSTHVTLSNNEGLYNAPISSLALAELVVQRSHVLGATSCFFFSQEDHQDYCLAASLIDANTLIRTSTSSDIFQPEQINHLTTQSERSFTATGDKLDYHWPIFSKLSSTGFGSIIRASIAPYQKCSSSCSFCSTANRNPRDTVPFDDAKQFLDKLFYHQADYNTKYFPEFNNLYKQHAGSDIRLRSLILTGGGQPNLWPHFQQFVEYAHSLGIELGLITNGFPKNIPDQLYKVFSWIRISITPADASPHYLEGSFENQYLPSVFYESSFLDRTTVGLSYVMGPWTQPDHIFRLNAYVNDHSFHYCRLLTDCNLPRDLQLKEHHRLSEIISGLQSPTSAHEKQSKLFHQLKYHASTSELHETFKDGQCLLQSYGLFWDSTGHSNNKESYCYPCDSVTVLASNDTGSVIDSARKFEPSIYGTVRWDNVSDLYTKPLRAFFDPREVCSGCLFFRNNRKVSSLLNGDFQSPSDFLNAPQHVNFP